MDVGGFDRVVGQEISNLFVDRVDWNTRVIAGVALHETCSRL